MGSFKRVFKNDVNYVCGKMEKEMVIEIICGYLVKISGKCE